jgi:hypothetical protein
MKMNTNDEAKGLSVREVQELRSEVRQLMDALRELREPFEDVYMYSVCELAPPEEGESEIVSDIRRRYESALGELRLAESSVRRITSVLDEANCPPIAVVAVPSPKPAPTPEAARKKVMHDLAMIVARESNRTDDPAFIQRAERDFDKSLFAAGLTAGASKAPPKKGKKKKRAA